LICLADVSIEVPPESKNGGKRLTGQEDDEYHQMQGTMKEKNQSTNLSNEYLIDFLD